MTKYISKRVYDAIQWRGNNIEEIKQFFKTPYYGGVTIEQLNDVDYISISFSFAPRKVNWLSVGHWFVIDKDIGDMQFVDNEEFEQTFAPVEVTK